MNLIFLLVVLIFVMLPFAWMPYVLVAYTTVKEKNKLPYFVMMRKIATAQ